MVVIFNIGLTTDSNGKFLFQHILLTKDTPLPGSLNSRHFIISNEFDKHNKLHITKYSTGFFLTTPTGMKTICVHIPE